METYLIEVHNAGVQLMGLIAEALQLPSDAFAKFYYSLDEIQSRAKEWPSLPMRSLGGTYTHLFFFYTFRSSSIHPSKSRRLVYWGTHHILILDS